MEHLGLFAKFWEPGKVKTRLAAKIGADAACSIYQCFLRHLIEGLAESANLRTVAFSPNDRESEFKTLCENKWGLVTQHSGDLGERMSHFFEWAHNENQRSANEEAGHSKVVLIGSDTPHLSPTIIREAFQLLDEKDVVLGPSGDGGYYLVGMSRKTFPIFDNVDWSTENVLSQTLNKLEQERLSVGQLREFTDIDHKEDLVELVRRLRECPDDFSERDQELLAAIEKVGFEGAGL